MDASFFDKNYFENGLVTGKSCYCNYRWLPELTIPMTFWMMHHLGIRPGDKVLDYGCGKGYVVKALRLLGVDASGVDISDYAISQCDPDVKKYCRVIDQSISFTHEKFDWLITKDVLEHLEQEDLEQFFYTYDSIADRQFHVIPLGDNGKFRIDNYHLDASHVQIQNEEWWISLFKNKGWKHVELQYQIKGIKEEHYKTHEHGNGFFILKKCIV